MHVQNYAYTNKSRHTYVHDMQQFLNPASVIPKFLLYLLHFMKYLCSDVKNQHVEMHLAFTPSRINWLVRCYNSMIDAHERKAEPKIPDD